MKIDEVMPIYEVRAVHRVHVRATAPQTWGVLLGSDFSDSFLVRILMSVRSGRVLRRGHKRSLRERLSGTGFMELAEIPGQEIVIGVAGRFWRPDGGRCFDVEPAGFAAFSRPGYAKAAWNFALAPEPSGCLLTTETRVQCFGRTALRNFRAYWAVIRPFSGLIRRAMLQHVKSAAESSRAPGAGS